MYCLIPETDEHGLKIGDGERRFNELPLIKEIESMRLDCEFSAHLINKIV